MLRSTPDSRRILQSRLVLQLATIKTKVVNCAENLNSLRQAVGLANMLKLHTLQTTDVIVVSLVANGWGLFKISDPKLSPETAASGAGKVTVTAPARRNPDF